jgi:hypothetical protein
MGAAHIADLCRCPRRRQSYSALCCVHARGCAHVHVSNGGCDMARDMPPMQHCDMLWVKGAPPPFTFDASSSSEEGEEWSVVLCGPGTAAVRHTYARAHECATRCRLIHTKQGTLYKVSSTLYSAPAAVGRGGANHFWLLARWCRPILVQSLCGTNFSHNTPLSPFGGCFFQNTYLCTRAPGRGRARGGRRRTE